MCSVLILTFLALQYGLYHNLRLDLLGWVNVADLLCDARRHIGASIGKVQSGHSPRNLFAGRNP